MNDKELNTWMDGFQDTQSIIRVRRVLGENLFEWFEQGVNQFCGDGTGTIVCENFAEVADWFKEWEEKRLLKLGITSMNKERWEGEDHVTFHDNNESFIFANNNSRLSFEYEYIFIVEGDCHFYSDGLKGKIIRAVK